MAHKKVNSLNQQLLKIQNSWREGKGKDESEHYLDALKANKMKLIESLVRYFL